MVVLFNLFSNGVFLRCPYCGKIGSWRFKEIGEAESEYDDEDILVSSRSQKVCNKCGQKVADTWSDFNGRTISKLENEPSN